MNPPGIDRPRATSALAVPVDEGPRLLLSWSDPLAELAGNLAAHLSGRVVPRFETTSAPDRQFWSGIDLRTPFPRDGAAASLAAHTALFALLYTISILPGGTVRLVESERLRAFGGSQVSLYLPELHGERTQRKAAGRYDPAPGLQEIRSLPEEPDNLRQTIVAPGLGKLKRDVALPNLAAMDPAPAIQPLAASSRAAALALPMMLPQIVQPAPDAAKAVNSKKLPAMLPGVVPPTADARGVRARGKLPQFVPLVVEPAPEADKAEAKLRLPNLLPGVVQPAPEVNVLARKGQGKLAQMLNRGNDALPPAPAAGEVARGHGALLALNLNPADIRPVSIPEGNRRGEFATAPTGRAGAQGTPGGNEAGRAANPAETHRNAPAGIDVAPGPKSAAASSVSLPSAPQPGSNSQSPGTVAAPDPSVRKKLLAAMRAPSPDGNIPARPPVEVRDPEKQLEARVFQGRRSYTLAINMPNLNSATGSWVIHFAEHDHQANPAPIAAPEVIHKSDPAYPGDLMHDGVQGTVLLTAVIRADGSVGEITVAKSLEPRLDHNAAEAFSHWRFHPAMKDGKAIAIEAVVAVPFRLPNAKF